MLQYKCTCRVYNSWFPGLERRRPEEPYAPPFPPFSQYGRTPTNTTSIAYNTIGPHSNHTTPSLDNRTALSPDQKLKLNLEESCSLCGGPNWSCPSFCAQCDHGFLLAHVFPNLRTTSAGSTCVSMLFGSMLLASEPTFVDIQREDEDSCAGCVIDKRRRAHVKSCSTWVDSGR